MPSTALPYVILLSKRTRTRTCPHPETTFGIALGYAAYIQIVLSVLIVMLLRLAGVVTVKGNLWTQLASITGTGGQAAYYKWHEAQRLGGITRVRPRQLPWLGGDGLDG